MDPVGNTNRDKRCCQRARHVALAAPFVAVGVTNRDKRVLFVPVAILLSRPGVSQPGNLGTNQRFCSSGVNLHCRVELTWWRRLWRLVRPSEHDMLCSVGHNIYLAVFHLTWLATSYLVP